MKVVIFAGGLGTRISEETDVRPKPMIEIGGKPILWHILKMYSHHGINDFIICCGYKGFIIKEYFANYFLYMSDVTFDMSSNEMEIHQRYVEPWRVTLVNTGEKTMTGGRLKKIEDYVKEEEAFCLTYGDGVSDIDITALVDFHHSHNSPATLTAITHRNRFGVLEVNSEQNVLDFREKSNDQNHFINGGFFVLSPDVINLIQDDQTVWERDPLETLAASNQLKAFTHKGFWHPMDTLRDKKFLEDLWASGNPPWKTWQ